jgi:cyclophilin family peptidyl-prolyl cis-trans isomerase
MRTLLLTFCALIFLAPSAHAGPDPDNLLVLGLPAGQTVIQMLPEQAPLHVAQIKKLTRSGFYDGLAWFRVIDGFMAQTGYPKARRKGGKSDLPDIPGEFTGSKFRRGTVGMGRSADPDSANSQFFICFTDTGCQSLNGSYTAWGQVVSGMEHVDALKRGEPPRDPHETIRAYIKADGPKDKGF